MTTVKTPKAPAKPELTTLTALHKEGIALKVRRNEWVPEMRAKAEEMNLPLASYQVFRSRYGGGLRKLRELLDIPGLVFWDRNKILATLRAISRHTDLHVDGDDWTPNVVKVAEEMGLNLPCYATARNYLGYLNEIQRLIPISTEKQDKRQREMLDALNLYKAKFDGYPKRGDKGKNGWGISTATNLEVSGMVLPSAGAYIRQFGSTEAARDAAAKLLEGEPSQDV